MINNTVIEGLGMLWVDHKNSTYHRRWTKLSTQRSNQTDNHGNWPADQHCQWRQRLLSLSL